jgi:DNA-binding GntR family transcriptional regulator
VKLTDGGGKQVDWDGASAPYLSPRAPGEADAWTDQAARAGRAGTQQIREVAEAVPPQVVAGALRLPAGAAAVVRRRTVFLDGAPIETVDSWYPASIAAGTALARPGKIKGGAVTLLADMGYLAGGALDDISVRGATEAEAALLAVPAGAPVIVVFRVVAAETGVPFEATVMIMVPEGRHLRYPLAAG